MKIHKRNKLIAIVSLIILLFTNYCVFADTATISYDRTGGSKVSSIARVIDGNYYLDGNYNAKSVEQPRFDEEENRRIFTLQYKVNNGAYTYYQIENVPEELQTPIRYVFLDSTANKNNYNSGSNGQITGFFFADTSSAAGGSMTTLKYGWRLPEGDVHIENVGTIEFNDALLYNGKLYRVDLNIKEVNKTGSSPIVLSTRFGKKETSGYSMDARDYTLGTFPTLGAEPAEEGEKDFKMEVKVEYSIHENQAIQENYDEDLVAVSGVWGVVDIDSNEGLVIHDYKADNNNTFIDPATLDETEADENLMYKYVNGGKDTYIFAKTDAYTDNASAYLKMDNVSTLNLTKTFDGKTVGSLFKFQDDVIKRYYNIFTKVTGGTITPSITNITKGETKEITFSPNDATKQYLKTIVVNGEEIEFGPNASKVTFGNIDKDISIEVVYANKYTVNFDAKGGTPTPEKQYVNSGEKATEPTTAPTKTGYTFGGWTLNGDTYTFNTPVTSDITLVAKWTPIKYKINYVLDGGTNNSENPSEYTVEDNVIFKTPTKANYTFDGWYTTADKTTTITELPVGTTGDKTIYAKWTPASGIAYKVQHYKMGTNGQYSATPTLEETKYGAINENVTATPQNYVGYEEDTTYTGRVASGKIQETGTLTLKLYYKPIEYTITYELNGGTNDVNNPTKYTVESNTITFKPATKSGYTFKAWYSDAACTQEMKEIPKGSTGNKKVYAKWENVEGVDYKVEHYLKKNGQYALETTDTLSGTTGSTVTATPKTFVGYAENASVAERVASGKIPESGTLVLKLYYDPISYKINYVLNGGTNDSTNPSTYTVENTVTFKNPTRAGYTFQGWYEESGFTTPITSTANKTGDITIYAKWGHVENVDYKVEHYLKKNGQYTLETTDTISGTAGSTVTAAPRTFTGYTENTSAAGRTASGKIPESGTLVLKLYYDPISYKINYVLNGGTNNSANPSTYTVENTVTFKAPTKAGYNFQGWYEEAGFKTPITSTANKIGDITLYAKWEAKGDTGYKVEHYKKNAQGSYTLATTTSYTGTTGVTVTATPQEFKGYAENTTYSERIATGTVKADGSLVLRLYYDPISYKINYVLNGGENDPKNPTTYTVNDNINLQPATREGYEFKGWYETQNFSGEQITSIVDRAEDITLYAKWEGKSTVYTIEHYLEDEDGEYELALTRQKEEKTDTMVTAEPLELQGYELNQNLGNRSGKVVADGSLVLKLYYSRAKYTVSFDPQNGKNIPNQIIPYLETAKEPDDPEREGYEFEYWYYVDADGNKVEYDFDTPVTSDIHLVAEYTALDDNTTSTTTIPQTGEFKPVVVFGMIALVTLAGAFGVKYFKFKKF